jgi:hypothetical protein
MANVQIEDLRDLLTNTQKNLKLDRATRDKWQARVIALETQEKNLNEQLQKLLELNEDIDEVFPNGNGNGNQYQTAPDDFSQLDSRFDKQRFEKFYTRVMNSSFDWAAKYGRNEPGDKTTDQFKAFFTEMKDGLVDFPKQIPRNKTGIWGIWFAGHQYVQAAIRNGEL